MHAKVSALRCGCVAGLLLLWWCSPALPAPLDGGHADSTAASAPADRWLDKDKMDHLVVSALLTGAQYQVLHREAGVDHEASLRAAAAGALVAGVVKELYDRTSGRGTASFKDLMADALGIALAAAVLSR